MAYGLNHSPFLGHRLLQQMISHKKIKLPSTPFTLKSSVYVDDIIAYVNISLNTLNLEQ